MSIKRVEPGRRMSQAVVHNGVVYLAGQVADKAAGAMVLMAHPCHSDSEPSFGQRY